MIGKIEIIKKSRARRSKLYYIRAKAVKDVRKKIRSVVNQEDLSARAEHKETEEKVVE